MMVYAECATCNAVVGDVDGDVVVERGDLVVIGTRYRFRLRSRLPRTTHFPVASRNCTSSSVKRTVIPFTQNYPTERRAKDISMNLVQVLAASGTPGRMIASVPVEYIVLLLAVLTATRGPAELGLSPT